MSPEAYTVSVLAIILLSTLVRAIFGFGNALVAMPLLAMIIDVRIATPLVALTGTVMAVSIILADWRSIRFGSTWRLTLASFVGIPIGLLFLKGAYEGTIKIVLAALLIGFSLYKLLRPRLLTLTDDRLIYAFGFVAGILGGAYNTNGPPIVIYGTLRKWSAQDMRATLQSYFLLTGLMVLVGHASAGLWTPNVMHLFAMSLPIVLLAVWLGAKIGHSIPQHKFDNDIYLLLIIVGVVLLIQTLGK